MSSDLQPGDSVKLIQFGVEFSADAEGRVMAQLLCEDDGNWHPHGSKFSAFWLQDLSSACQMARLQLGLRALPEQWGWRFREPAPPSSQG